ncbi:MAG TPA: FUSC family protein [Victivallales bacterium]|nr:FUSC family protein [Victivallales bacterium]
MKNITYIQNRFNIQEAICISTAYAIALIMYIYFDTQHASWIPMTVGLMFLIPIQGVIVQRSLDRVFGTTIGLLLCFFYVQTFMFLDYRWAYLVPVAFFIIFYVIFTTQNYGLGVIAVSMFVPLAGIFFEQNTNYSLGLTLAKRLFFTLIGVCIALICEFTIYKYAAHSERHLKKNTRQYFIRIGEILSICNMAFAENIPLNDDLRTKLNMMIGHVMSIDRFYLLAKYEYAYDDNKKFLLTFVSNKIHEIVKSLQLILCILNQDKLNDDIIGRDDYRKISRSLTFKYRNYVKLIYSNLTKSDRLEIIGKIKKDDWFTPTGLYLTQLDKLDNLFYLTISGIKNEEYLKKDDTLE